MLSCPNMRLVSFQPSSLLYAHPIQGCYLFAPENIETDGLAVPKTKRRKLSKPDHIPEQSDQPSFFPLLTGLENAKSVKARSNLFHVAWSPRQALIDVCIIA